MKIAIIISACFFCINSAYAQNTSQEKKMKVLDFKEYDNGYVIKGVEQVALDTMYFISLKSTLECKKGFKRIKVGKEYQFRIEDMDNNKGSFPPALPNGYSVKFENATIKRMGRNGNTITTTQFLSRNSKGLLIKED